MGRQERKKTRTCRVVRLVYRHAARDLAILYGNVELSQRACKVHEQKEAEILYSF